jgi:holo-[acyl-carrier protein] synthase
MRLATGIDLIEINRVEKAIQRHDQRFLRRIFTPAELAECEGRVDSLAARFAAKEAVAKALSVGIGRVGWQEIEIERGPANEPRLRLTGMASQLATEMGVNTWSVSLSHTHTHALAMVVAVGD